MANTVFWVFGIFFALIMAGIISYLMYLLFFKEEEIEVPADGTIIDIFPTKLTKGYSLGVMDPKGSSRKIRNRISFIPRDVGDEKLEINQILANDNMIINFPRGIWSRRRNRMWILPRNPDELSDDLKKTPIGSMIATYISLKNTESNIIKALKEGNDRMAESLKQYAYGEAPDSLINQFKKAMLDAMDLKIKSSSEKRSQDTSK